MSDPLGLRDGALAYLERLRLGPGRYGMTESLAGSLFSDCFAFFARRLLNDPYQESERSAFVERLLVAQDPDTGLWTGGVRQSGLDQRHDPLYVDGQLATFALAALIALGEKPRYRLRVLDAWPDAGSLSAHLDALAWRENPWNSGNRSMQAGILLSADRLLWGTARSIDRLEDWFAWHAERARPRSGFWGDGDWADGHVGLGGASHQHVLYDFWGRVPPFADAALATTLELQYPDGRYWPVPGGGSCTEMDAAEVCLASLGRGAKGDQDRERVARAMRKVVEIVLSSRNPDGGFCWARRRWFDFADAWTATLGARDLRARVWTARALVNAHLLRNQERHRTAWSEGEHLVTESSAFDTWFRLLTLALCAQACDDPRLAGIDFQPLPAPNWGFFRPAARDTGGR